MSITQREVIIRNGLGDREITVRNAAASLLGRWVEAVTETVPKEEGGEKSKPKVHSGLVALLKMLDLSDRVVPVDALLSLFATKPDIFDNMEFDGKPCSFLVHAGIDRSILARIDEYWAALTPETAFLARVFVEHCRDSKDPKDQARLEAALPVVTFMAFRVQEAYNGLMESVHSVEEEKLMRDFDEQEQTKVDEERHEKEFIIGEMLKLAVNLDYSDEIGRRKMFQLVRGSFSSFPSLLLVAHRD